MFGEIASSYYELLALDNMLEIINQNVENQTIALTTVKLQKESAKANQLAVNRFEALLLHTKNLQYELQQRVVETKMKQNLFLENIPKLFQEMLLYLIQST